MYDLYLPTLGGGEKYLLEMAEVVSERWTVEVAAPRLPALEQMARFGIPTRFPRRRLHPASFVMRSRGASLAVYLANGVPLPSLAERSIAIVQFPMRTLGRGRAASLLRGQILDRYDLLTYSAFVRDWIAQRWDRPSTVVPPPVQLGNFSPASKEPMVVAVGRFFAVQHSKRQDILVRAFRQLVEETGTTWTLALVGGASGSAASAAFIERIQAEAKGLAVKFVFNATQQELCDLYTRASLFWHAAGFGRSPDAPEQAEHFGMSTVEAMSYGAVPLVYDDGGQREVLDRGGGRLWSTVEELLENSRLLMEDESARNDLAASAAKEAARFSVRHFRARMRDVLELPQADETMRDE